MVRKIKAACDARRDPGTVHPLDRLVHGLGLSDAEVALACASHGGEPRHVEAVAAWLDRLGLGEGDAELITLGSLEQRRAFAAAFE